MTCDLYFQAKMINAMCLQNYPVAALALGLVVCANGCQQGTNVPNPLSVFAPPHVPAPATGSYAVPDQYYKGQANTSRESTNLLASTDEAAVGSGVSQTNFAARGSGVVPASHQETSNLTDNSSTGYRGVTPSIPRAAMRSNSFPSTSNTSAGLQQSDNPPQFSADNQSAPAQHTARSNPLNWRSPASSQY